VYDNNHQQSHPVFSLAVKSTNPRFRGVNLLLIRRGRNDAAKLPLLGSLKQTILLSTRWWAPCHRGEIRLPRKQSLSQLPQERKEKKPFGEKFPYARSDNGLLPSDICSSFLTAL
jgi:hypothetical protein